MSKDEKIKRILKKDPEPKEDRAKELSLRILQGAGGIPCPVSTPEELFYFKELMSKAGQSSEEVE